MGLMENMDTLNIHQKQVGESAGSAKKMMDEAYNGSLDAKVNDLKRSFEGLYEKIMSSDSLKYFVTEATQLVNVLSNVDGKTIAYIATIGSLVLVMTKLSKINKELMLLTTEGGIVTGLTKFMGIASGMIALEDGATGLATAFGLVGTSIKGATASAVAFMLTPLGLLLSALAGALAMVVYGMVSYQQHEASLAKQSNDLKTALDGVNESLKNGDTKGASTNLDKIKKDQAELERLMNLKKETQDKLNNASETKIVGQNGLTEAQQLRDILSGLNKQVDEYSDVMKKAGISTDTLAEAEQQIANIDMVNKIKEETKAQVEHRTNTEANTEEYNKYMETVQSLYATYNNLSAQENLSTEQKKELTGVVEQLQGKIGNLDTQMDANGKTYITNTGLISDTISYMNTEGKTVEVLTQVKLEDQKANATWQYNNTSITYTDTLARIADYQAEIGEIQKLIDAKITLASSASTAPVDAWQASSDVQEVSDNADKINKDKEELAKLKAGKDAIDKLYTSMTLPTSSAGGVSDSSYEPDGSSASKSKKAEQELIAREKKMIDDITDAYNKGKETIADDIEQIDASITTLGEADDSNFTQRIDLTTQKIAKQKEEVQKAQEQLDALKNTTVSTAEANESLENATLKANKELRTQTLEVYKLNQEMEKTIQEQEKSILEKQKEIDTQKLEAQQKAQNDKLDAIKTKEEDIHNAKLEAFASELKALDDENDAIEKANALQEKNNTLKEKEAQLARDEKQRSVQTLVQQNDGSWQYQYVLSQKTIIDDKKAVTDANKDLEDIKRKDELDKKKKVLESEKTEEENSYKKKKEYLDKYSDNLKEAQDRDKRRIENYYSDIDKLAKDTLGKLVENNNNDWNAIANSIDATLTKTKKSLEELTTLRANFTTNDADNAINSGDISKYLQKNKDKITEKSKVDNNDIDNHLKSIGSSANNANESLTQLSKTYDDLLSKKDSSIISEEDIKNRKNQINNIVNIDSSGLNENLKNLQDTDKKLEDEYDSYYKKLFDKQTKAQSDQQNSLKNFANIYTKFTDKFLELVQIIYDYRFTNIVSIATSSSDLIMQLLVDMESSYVKFQEMYNNMHEGDKNFTPMNSIDISQELANFEKYKQSVLDLTSSKLSLYNDSNNPLYSDKAKANYTETSAYSGLSSYTLDSSNLLSSTNSTTNNNSNAKTINQYSITDVKVNANNAEEFIKSMLEAVESETNLSN